MRIGPFYFDTKELFLMLAAIFLGIATYFDWPILVFEKSDLLTLTILFLITKGLLPGIHNENFLILAVVALFLTLFFPILQVVLIFFLALIMFRLLKVI